MSSANATAASMPRHVRLEKRLRQAMLVLLALFLFTLPLVEAPKNIAFALYVLVWCVRAAVARDAGGTWDRFDTAFFLMLASALVSGFAGYAGDVTGVIRVVGLAWLVKRAPPARLPPVRLAACLGLLVAIPIGLVPFLRGQRLFFELPSVGQVNQSALYIAILAATTFGWWVEGARAGQGGWRRWVLGGFATLFWAALLVGASRAAIVAGVAAVAVILLAIVAVGTHPGIRRVLGRAAATLALLLAMVAALTAVAPELSQRKLTPEKIAATLSMEIRMRHWRLAVEGWRQRPWVGWGPDSFQRLKVEDICTWRAQHGETCDTTRYETTKHAHSLYVATLVERGLLGIAALGFLLLAWGWALVRSARTAAASTLWVASAASLVVVVVGGVFNTTMRVEHGSLALLWLGLWLAQQRPKPPPPA
jgi:O-antigen ligase